MRQAKVLPGVIALLIPFHVWSQDLLTIAPGATVEYEDSRVRVVRLRIPPNATLPMHERPARVVIPLTVNDVRIARADGTTRTTRTPAGQVAWSEPARRTVTNLANVAIENIIVEIKTAMAPAQARAAPPAPVPPAYLAEPRHQWLFENQYVRVYDTRLPPGVTTEFHRHAYDAVTVFVSGGLMATQVEGEPWGRTERVEPGRVVVSADSRRPYVHRVRNDGSADYRVVLVQLLPE